MSNPERYQDLPPETGFQRLVSAVLYQGPEILAGLLLILIGWALSFPPASWLGLAGVLGALVAAVARLRRDTRLTAHAAERAAEQAVPAPAPDEQTGARTAGPSDSPDAAPDHTADHSADHSADHTADHAMSPSTTVDQPESGRQA